MAKDRITISIDPEMLARVRDAVKASATADTVSAQIVHYIDVAERVEERWTPRPPVGTMWPLPAALDDHLWRFFVDPCRATVVALHELGLWVECDAEFYEMSSTAEAEAIAEAMQSAVYDDPKTGRHQVVLTRNSDGYTAVLEAM